MFFSYEEYKEFEKKKYNRIEQETWDFFIKDRDMYGFDEREGQQDMSLDITQCISEHQHIVVEAGVGIGKSFAYIVPLLLYNKYFKKPVVIATSTIALQEQLSTDLETISKKLNYFPDVIIAKGQTHFLCIKRATEYLCDGEKETYDLILREIQNNAAERKDFSVQINNKLWDKICVVNFSSKKCAICEFNRNCRYYNLRNEMLSTRGIIVCNQDLLTVHLRKMATDQKELLNRVASLIVVDEAHNLEDKVRNSYTIGYSENKILNIAENAIRSIKISEERIDKEFYCLENNLKKLYNKFKNQIKKQIEKDPDYMKYAERFYVNLH